MSRWQYTVHVPCAFCTTSAEMEVAESGLNEDTLKPVTHECDVSTVATMLHYLAAGVVTPGACVESLQEEIRRLVDAGATPEDMVMGTSDIGIDHFQYRKTLPTKRPESKKPAPWATFLRTPTVSEDDVAIFREQFVATWQNPPRFIYSNELVDQEKSDDQ